MTIRHASWASCICDTSCIVYILGTFYDARTTISVVGNESREIRFSRDVKQGDPLSSLLFNLVIDKLLVRLGEDPSSGGSITADAKVRVVAFAGNIILLEDREIDMTLILDGPISFIRSRGMTVNLSQ